MHFSSQILTILGLSAALVAGQSQTASLVTAPLPDPTPSVPVKTNTLIGCYAVDSSLTVQYGYIYQASGWCQKVCLSLSSPAPIMGLGAGAYCYCGTSLPSQKVDLSKCDTSCQGYPVDKCGGDNYWSVYSTGLKDKIDSSGGSSSASSGVTSTARPTISTVTQGGTVFVTSVVPTSTDSSNSGSGSGGGSTAGIAAGVVVGIIILAAIVGGTFLLLRHRKKKAIEVEHRRAAAASELMASKRAQAASPFDARLEPVMLQKRQSDGSIADHQDYSRRILKVGCSGQRSKAQSANHL